MKHGTGMSSYDVYQRVFRLSLASNIGGNVKGTQTALQKGMQLALPNMIKLIGPWNVVWGPVVWKSEPNDATTGPDETWYIAKNSEVRFEDGNVYETYVIAVAGTATKYTMDRNFLVNSVVDFAAWVAGGVRNRPSPVRRVDSSGVYVAYGTAADVHTLLSYPAPEGAASAGSTLYDFMAGLSSSPSSRIVFTGHSRGGVLSPTLALALLQAGILPTQGVLAYPTAAASPGNANFAQLFASRFPKTAGSGYQVWNTHIFNTLDIVSQAWCTTKKIMPKQNLNNITLIYGSPAIPRVFFSVQYMKQRANTSKIIYIPLQGVSFSGQPPERTPEDRDEFLAIARDQHILQYMKFFGVKPFSVQPLLAQDGITEMTDEEVNRSQPVIGTIAYLSVYGDSDPDIQEEMKREGLFLDHAST
jgi:hypothetical protein